MNFSRTLVSTAIILGLSTTAFNAQSQNNNEKSAGEQDIETISVFGHKLTVAKHDAAASISQVNDEHIKRNQEAELSNILKELPGVDMTGSVTPLSGQPAIRGLYGERIFVSIDNVKRKTESDGGSNIATINSLGIDPAQLKQVQVLRGADSLTVGSGAVGGSIRLVTKDASDYLNGEEGFGVRAQVMHQSVSDSNSFSGSLFALTAQTDTVLHASYVEFSDIDVVPSDDKGDEVGELAKLEKISNDSARTNATIKNTWYLAPDHSLQTKLDWSETESLNQPYGQRLDLALRYPTLSEDYKNDYIELMSSYTYQPTSPLIDLDVQAVFSKKSYDEVTMGYIVNRGNKIAFDKLSDGSNTRTGLRIANLSEFEGVINHKLALEFNFEYEEFEQNEFEEGVSSTFYGKSDSTNFSFAAIDQASFLNDTLLTTAGLRYDVFDRSSNTFDDYDNSDSGELSSELGVTYKATDFLNFYAKYAEAFRAPSVQELYKKDEWRCHIGGKICYQEPQPDLKPELSENIEVGFGLDWSNVAFADVFTVKAMYFNNDIENFIDNVPFMYYVDENGNKQLGSPGPNPSNGVPVATHRDYSAKNIGKLESSGVELELHYSLSKFDAYLGYSTIEMDAYGVPNFFLGTIENDKQAYTEAPADKLTLNLNYQVLDSLNVGVQMLAYAEQKRLPEAYLDRGWGTDSYQLYNLNASYQGEGVLSGLGVVVGVDNITNERYLRAPASNATDAGELGRNYKITLSYQF